MTSQVNSEEAGGRAGHPYMQCKWRSKLHLITKSIPSQESFVDSDSRLRSLRDSYRD